MTTKLADESRSDAPSWTETSRSAFEVIDPDLSRIESVRGVRHRRVVGQVRLDGSIDPSS